MSLAAILRELTQLIYPPRCQVCDRSCPAPLCAECAEGFRRIEPPLCRRCGAPLDPQARSGPVCADCLGSEGWLTATRSCGLHQGSLRKAVNAYKFGGRRRLAQPLAALLVDLLGDAPGALPMEAPLHGVVPVPLHPRRRRERGFDQAELLARPLAQAVGVPLRSGLLVRTRHTPPQVRRTPRERRENVRGAFAVAYPLPVPQARLLLVDDVYTTGATLAECARTLRQAGAGEVYAVTLSRAAPDWMPANAA